jgi:opacity protein-like surface antigen
MTYAAGGGVDVHVKGPFWMRADYEYQFWKTGFYKSTDTLNPRGVTLGVAYDFRGRSASR